MECWATTRKRTQVVAEMRMLDGFAIKTRKVKNRNERMEGYPEITHREGKIRERRLA